MKAKHLAVLSIASLMMLASCTPTNGEGNSSNAPASAEPTTSQAPTTSAEGSSASSATPSSDTASSSNTPSSSDTPSSADSSESIPQESTSEAESSTPEETITKIKDINKDDVATIVGKVTTLLSDGCVVDDGTGTIHFQKVIADWAVGDIVKISGTFGLYYGDKQTGYGSSCTSAEKVTDVTIERTLLDDAITLTAESYDAMAENVTSPVAVTFSATAVQNDKYTNFYVDDASTHYISPSKLKLPEGKAFEIGKFYQLTGYLASYNTKNGVSQFYVVDFVEKAIEVTAISVTAAGDKTSLTTGETIQLNATLTPTNTTQTGITWLSSDPDTASVDENGLVTTKKAGTVTITAKSSVKETVTGTIQLTIADPVANVSSITLDKSELSLMVGDDSTLVATIEADEGATKAVNWTSDNEEVATVDSNGKVTATGVGTAHIKVETVETNAEGNKLSATCTVTVVEKIDKIGDLATGDVAHVIGKITTIIKNGYFIDDGTGVMQLYFGSKFSMSSVSIGEVKEVKGTVSDNYGCIQFNCSTAGAVTITDSETTIGDTTLAHPTALTAASFDEDAESSDNIYEAVSFTAKAIKSGSFTNLKVDGTSTHVLSPSQTTFTLEEGKSYNCTGYLGSWNSSAKYRGFYLSTCELVPVALESITVSSASGTSVVVGGSLNLNAALTPSDTTQTEVVWSSSDPTKATVSDEGVVNALAAGTVTITATSKVNDTISGSIELTIKTPSYISGVTLDKTTLSLVNGQSSKLTATVSSDGEDFVDGVTWSSDHPEIAKVDENGNVTGVASGSAVITATSKGLDSEGGHKTATCAVTVEATTAVATIDFSKGWETSDGESSDYQSSFDVTRDGKKFTFSSWSNNSQKWLYIKTGSSKRATTASIAAATPFEEEIKTITLSLDTMDKVNCTSITLYSSSSADFSAETTESVSLTDKTQFVSGDLVLSPKTVLPNRYYKIEFAINKTSKNGSIQLSKIIFDA